MSTRSTQTAAQYVSIGLQTDNLSSTRGAGLHSKAWSPRPSSTTASSLASARTRQISTSLDKVHSRIERPCCSPKYGSPKLQRRVSSGNSTRLFYIWVLYGSGQRLAQRVRRGSSVFRFHFQTRQDSNQQGSHSVEPPAETRGWRFSLGPLHHHQRQPCPQRPHRRPQQPVQRGGTLRKHGVAVEG